MAYAGIRVEHALALTVAETRYSFMPCDLDHIRDD